MYPRVHWCLQEEDESPSCELFLIPYQLKISPLYRAVCLVYTLKCFGISHETLQSLQDVGGQAQGVALRWSSRCFTAY